MCPFGISSHIVLHSNYNMKNCQHIQTLRYNIEYVKKAFTIQLHFHYVEQYPITTHVLFIKKLLLRKKCTVAQKAKKVQYWIWKPRKVHKSNTFKIQKFTQDSYHFCVIVYRFLVVTYVLQCYVCVVPVCCVAL